MGRHRGPGGRRRVQERQRQQGHGGRRGARRKERRRRRRSRAGRVQVSVLVPADAGEQDRGGRLPAATAAGGGRSVRMRFIAAREGALTLRRGCVRAWASGIRGAVAPRTFAAQPIPYRALSFPALCSLFFLLSHVTAACSSQRLGSSRAASPWETRAAGASPPQP